jgi:hypothetical protein
MSNWEHFMLVNAFYFVGFSLGSNLTLARLVGMVWKKMAGVFMIYGPCLDISCGVSYM